MVKYKSKMPLGDDNRPADAVKEEEFPVAHVPTRTERAEQQRKEQEFGDYSDLKPILQKVRGYMVSQETYLPKGDLQTLSDEEWKTQREKKE